MTKRRILFFQKDTKSQKLGINTTKEKCLKSKGAIDQIEHSHNKLRQRGFVMKLEELPAELRHEASAAGYYIPWRTVQSDSLSTPTRMVFDASSRTSTGNSLNCLLAKGRNMLAEMIITVKSPSVEGFKVVLSPIATHLF